VNAVASAATACPDRRGSPSTASAAKAISTYGGTDANRLVGTVMGAPPPPGSRVSTMSSISSKKPIS